MRRNEVWLVIGGPDAAVGLDDLTDAVADALPAVLDRLPHTSLVMNIDVQGVRSIRAAAREMPLLRDRLVTMFVAPDSMEVLRERLAARGAVTDEELERRLQSAEFELAERSSYDFVIHSGTKEQDFLALRAFWTQAQSRLARG